LLLLPGGSQYKELYFFSTETFTTVGYGRVNPVGDGVNMVAAIEAIERVSFFCRGYRSIYGRFAKPDRISHLVIMH
jgi:inward rectifier potassium channel